MRRIAMLVAVATALVAGWHGQEAASAGGTLPAVVVTKLHGAALRTHPSATTPIAYVAACGELLSVAGQQDGWYRVYSRAGYYWVGGARVADAGTTTPDCTGARIFQPGREVVTFVPSGCLSLRPIPSRSAAIDSCVSNGHVYVVTNGPVEVDGEEWIGVWSASTGDGWLLAAYLQL